MRDILSLLLGAIALVWVALEAIDSGLKVQDIKAQQIKSERQMWMDVK
jgi:hypothetical protein